MAALNDGDVELNGYVISGGTGRPVHVKSLDPGIAGVRDQDAPNPFGDGKFFGRDYFDGPTWTLRLGMGEGSTDDAFDALDEVMSAWRSGPRTPGAESVLRYRRGSRTRRVYGRPRQFAPDTERVYYAGDILASATFDAADPYYYDDTARTLQVGMVPVNAGGLLSPLTGPLTTVAGAARQGVIEDTGGKAPSPFTAVIRGPISNPYIKAEGWRLELATTLAYDQSVTIDTRRMTVLRNDGASLGGKLSRASRLATARLKPGSTEVIFGGTDATGTATCTLTWRPAFYAL